MWIGGTGSDLRSKTKILTKLPEKIEDYPVWNYDGSSTGQAPGDDSEVFLVARAVYKDPFRGGDNVLVLCDTYEPPRTKPDGTVVPMKPLPTNTRCACNEAMDKAKGEEPWFGTCGCRVLLQTLALPWCPTNPTFPPFTPGIEQEYTLLDTHTKWPLGWPEGGYPGPQGPYYCSAGSGNSIGRDVIEAHLKACMYAGLNISGINGEVMPSQWEYQVGPCEGISMGDDLWMSRYILYRVCEVYNVDATFDPKPIPGGMLFV